MIVLGVDPGTTHSGWVVLRAEPGESVTVLESSKETDNFECLRLFGERLREHSGLHVAVETMTNYGQGFGMSAIQACIWVGRFTQYFCDRGTPVTHLERQDHVYMTLLGVRRGGNNSAIRKALIAMVGEPGTKKNPGPTYGLASHAWSALAIAVTYERLFSRGLIQLPETSSKNTREDDSNEQ